MICYTKSAMSRALLARYLLCLAMSIHIAWAQTQTLGNKAGGTFDSLPVTIQGQWDEPWDGRWKGNWGMSAVHLDNAKHAGQRIVQYPTAALQGAHGIGPSDEVLITGVWQASGEQESLWLDAMIFTGGSYSRNISLRMLPGTDSPVIAGELGLRIAAHVYGELMPGSTKAPYDLAVIGDVDGNGMPDLMLSLPCYQPTSLTKLRTDVMGSVYASGPINGGFPPYLTMQTFADSEDGVPRCHGTMWVLFITADLRIERVQELVSNGERINRQSSSGGDAQVDEVHTGVPFGHLLWTSRPWNFGAYGPLAGASVLGIGDINDDGVPDVLVSLMGALGRPVRQNAQAGDMWSTQWHSRSFQTGSALEYLQSTGSQGDTKWAEHMLSGLGNTVRQEGNSEYKGVHMGGTLAVFILAPSGAYKAWREVSLDEAMHFQGSTMVVLSGDAERNNPNVSCDQGDMDTVTEQGVHVQKFAARHLAINVGSSLGVVHTTSTSVTVAVTAAGGPFHSIADPNDENLASSWHTLPADAKYGDICEEVDPLMDHGESDDNGGYDDKAVDDKNGGQYYTDDGKGDAVLSAQNCICKVVPKSAADAVPARVYLLTLDFSLVRPELPPSNTSRNAALRDHILKSLPRDAHEWFTATCPSAMTLPSLNASFWNQSAVHPVLYHDTAVLPAPALTQGIPASPAIFRPARLEQPAGPRDQLASAVTKSMLGLMLHAPAYSGMLALAGVYCGTLQELSDAGVLDISGAPASIMAQYRCVLDMVSRPVQFSAEEMYRRVAAQNGDDQPALGDATTSYPWLAGFPTAVPGVTPSADPARMFQQPLLDAASLASAGGAGDALPHAAGLVSWNPAVSAAPPAALANDQVLRSFIVLQDSSIHRVQLDVAASGGAAGWSMLPDPTVRAASQATSAERAVFELPNGEVLPRGSQFGRATALLDTVVSGTTVEWYIIVTAPYESVQGEFRLIKYTADVDTARITSAQVLLSSKQAPLNTPDSLFAGTAPWSFPYSNSTAGTPALEHCGVDVAVLAKQASAMPTWQVLLGCERGGALVVDLTDFGSSSWATGAVRSWQLRPGFRLWSPHLNRTAAAGTDCNQALVRQDSVWPTTAMPQASAAFVNWPGWAAYSSAERDSPEPLQQCPPLPGGADVADPSTGDRAESFAFGRAVAAIARVPDMDAGAQIQSRYCDSANCMGTLVAVGAPSTVPYSHDLRAHAAGYGVVHLMFMPKSGFLGSGFPPTQMINHDGLPAGVPGYRAWGYLIPWRCTWTKPGAGYFTNMTGGSPTAMYLSAFHSYHGDHRQGCGMNDPYFGAGLTTVPLRHLEKLTVPGYPSQESPIPTENNGQGSFEHYTELVGEDIPCLTNDCNTPIARHMSRAYYMSNTERKTADEYDYSNAQSFANVHEQWPLFPFAASFGGASARYSFASDSESSIIGSAVNSVAGVMVASPGDPTAPPGLGAGKVFVYAIPDDWNLRAITAQTRPLTDYDSSSTDFLACAESMTSSAQSQTSTTAFAGTADTVYIESRACKQWILPFAVLNELSTSAPTPEENSPGARHLLRNSFGRGMAVGYFRNGISSSADDCLDILVARSFQRVDVDDVTNGKSDGGGGSNRLLAHPSAFWNGEANTVTLLSSDRAYATRTGNTPGEIWASKGDPCTGETYEETLAAGIRSQASAVAWQWGNKLPSHLGNSGFGSSALVLTAGSSGEAFDTSSDEAVAVLYGAPGGADGHGAGGLIAQSMRLFCAITSATVDGGVEYDPATGQVLTPTVSVTIKSKANFSMLAPAVALTDAQFPCTGVSVAAGPGTDEYLLKCAPPPVLAHDRIGTTVHVYMPGEARSGLAAPLCSSTVVSTYEPDDSSFDPTLTISSVAAQNIGLHITAADGPTADTAGLCRLGSASVLSGAAHLSKVDGTRVHIQGQGFPVRAGLLPVVLLVHDDKLPSMLPVLAGSPGDAWSRLWYSRAYGSDTSQWQGSPGGGWPVPGMPEPFLYGFAEGGEHLVDVARWCTGARVENATSITCEAAPWHGRQISLVVAFVDTVAGGIAECEAPLRSVLSYMPMRIAGMVHYESSASMSDVQRALDLLARGEMVRPGDRPLQVNNIENLDSSNHVIAVAIEHLGVPMESFGSVAISLGFTSSADLSEAAFQQRFSCQAGSWSGLAVGTFPSASLFVCRLDASNRPYSMLAHAFAHVRYVGAGELAGSPDFTSGLTKDDMQNLDANAEEFDITPVPLVQFPVARVERVTPNSGAASTTLIIRGENFGSQALIGVWFGPNFVPNNGGCSVISTSYISCTVPPLTSTSQTEVLPLLQFPSFNVTGDNTSSNSFFQYEIEGGTAHVCQAPFGVSAKRVVDVPAEIQLSWSFWHDVSENQVSSFRVEFVPMKQQRACLAPVARPPDLVNDVRWSWEAQCMGGAAAPRPAGDDRHDLWSWACPRYDEHYSGKIPRPQEPQSQPTNNGWRRRAQANATADGWCPAQSMDAAMRQQATAAYPWPVSPWCGDDALACSSLPPTGVYPLGACQASAQGETESQVSDLTLATIAQKNYSSSVLIGGKYYSRVDYTHTLLGMEAVPYMLRVRAQAADSDNRYGPYSMSVGPVFEACSKRQFLASHLPTAGQHVCAPCPDGAVCTGGDTRSVVAAPGYWPVPWADNGLTFMRCKTAAACPGGNSSAGIAGQCAAGHTGVLCSGCVPGFQLGADGTCSVCNERLAVMLALFAWVVGYGLFIGYLVYSALKAGSASAVNDAAGNERDAIKRMLVSHVQANAILLSFKVTWPAGMGSLLGGFAMGSNVTSSLLNFDCVTGDVVGTFVLKTFLTLVMPVLWAVMAALVWACMGLFRVKYKAYLAARTAAAALQQQQQQQQQQQPDGALGATKASAMHEARGSGSADSGPAAISRPGQPDEDMDLAPDATAGRPEGAAAATGTLAPSMPDMLDDTPRGTKALVAAGSASSEDETDQLGKPARLPSVLRGTLSEADLTATWFQFNARRWVITMILVFFLLQSSLTSTALQLLACFSTAGGRSFLVAEPNIECDASTSAWRLPGGLLGFALYGLTLPILIAVYLYRRRATLREVPATRQRWAFMFAGLRPGAELWEPVVMLRKSVLALATVFLADRGVEIQALAAAVVFVFSLMLQGLVSPYELSRTNHLELASLLVTVCTMLGGLYFGLFPEGSVSDVERVLVSVSVLLLNVGFLVFAIGRLFSLVSKAFYAKLRRSLGSKNTAFTLATAGAAAAAVAQEARDAYV